MNRIFKIGTVIGLNFQDGCGIIVGVIAGESYKYSHADGQEHTFFSVQPAPEQGFEDPFQISLDEAVRYGVALPSSVLDGVRS